MGKLRATVTTGAVGFVLLIPGGVSAQSAATGAVSSGSGAETQAQGALQAPANDPAQPLDLQFEAGSAAITVDVNSQLYGLAAWLAEDPQRTVAVAAVDASPLAHQRVETVQSYLRARGVDAARIAASRGGGTGSGSARLVKVTERAGGATSEASSAALGSALGSEPLLGAPESVAKPAAKATRATSDAPPAGSGAVAAVAPQAVPAASTSVAPVAVPVAAPVAPAADPAKAAQPLPPPNWSATPGAGRTLTKGKPRREAARSNTPLPVGAGHAFEYGRSADTLADSDALAWRDASAPRLSGKGVGITVGGGVVGFLDSNTADVANVGGLWEARLVYGTRSLVAVEAAYVGSAQSLALAGMPDNTLLMGHGAEGNMRFNITQGVVQPYVFGGGGWTRYSLTRSRAGGDGRIGESDNVFVVPAGIGVSVRNKGMLFDLRGTTRFVFNETMMRGTFSDRAGDGDLSSWNVSGKLGWEL